MPSSDGCAPPIAVSIRWRCSPRSVAARRNSVERIARRGLAAAADAGPADPLAFARALATNASTGEVRATHRRVKRKYKTRMRMPSKLDPHLATIEDWLAAEPQITALAIVRRLAAIDPEAFGDKQHSIVQRLLKALRRKAAHRVIAETAAEGARQKCPTRVSAALRSGYALPPARQHPRHSNRTISDRPRLPPVTFLPEAIRGVKIVRRLTLRVDLGCCV